MRLASATDRDALLPQRQDGLGLGALLALLAHGLLVAALAFGIRWRTSEPEGVSAELWAATPQVAAAPAVDTPPPPPPKPAPRVVEAPPPKDLQKDAQIAIEKAEREKKEQQEREKREKLKAEQEKAEKAEKAEKDKAEREKKAERAKTEEQRLAKLREDNLQRMLGQAGATGAPGSTGNAARDAGPSASYAGRVIARIRPNIVLTAELNGDPRVEVEVRTAPDGTIVGRRVVKSSGQPLWDEAVLRAIDRTEVLPRDVDGRVPPLLLLGVKPLQ